jgi:hypothetical protein
MSPSVWLPPVRFAAFRSVVCNRLVGLLVPHSRRALAVSDGTSRFVPAAVPRAVSRASSSSRKLHAPSETPLSRPPRASRRGAPSLGLAFPLRDINRPRRCNGFPYPPPSVLSVPPAPDGLLRVRPCGFISPRSHVQGSPTRRSSSHSRDASSTPPCPLVVGSSSLPPVARRRHVPEPRPQGFVPCESSGVVATVFSRRVDPPPRGSILLQVLSPIAVRTPSRPFRS